MDESTADARLRSLPPVLTRLAVVLLALGAVVLAAGAVRAADAAESWDIRPYLISGVIGGAALIGLGGVTWWSSRAIARELTHAAQLAEVADSFPTR